MLGLIEKQRGNLQAAGDAVKRAMDLGAGSLVFLASCKNNLADIERLRGNLDQADLLLREASALNRATGDEDWDTHLNAGLILWRAAGRRTRAKRSNVRCGGSPTTACRRLATPRSPCARRGSTTGTDSTSTCRRSRASRSAASGSTWISRRSSTRRAAPAARKSQQERADRALAMAAHQWHFLGAQPASARRTRGVVSATVALLPLGWRSR
jgi:ATP/maltotriose-dependent transcriptional regulator MalT